MIETLTLITLMIESCSMLNITLSQEYKALNSYNSQLELMFSSLISPPQSSPIKLLIP